MMTCVGRPSRFRQPNPAGGTIVQVGYKECQLITTVGQITVPSVPTKPAYLASITDPTFGTKITRITGDPGVAIPIIGGTWPDVCVHNYSKDAVWSCDQSRMVLKRVAGANAYIFLDGSTYQVTHARAGIPGETRWSATLPDEMDYVSASGDIGTWNVVTGATTVRATRSGYSNCALGPYEGNMSHDSNVVAIAATRNSDSKEVVFAYHIPSQTFYADIDLVAVGCTSLDYCSISASGNYVLVHGTISGTSVRTKIFDLNANELSFWSEFAHPSHFDYGFDQAGVEVFVGTFHTPPNEGKQGARRVVLGTEYPVTDGGYGSHTSLRNVKLPGWGFTDNRGNWNPSWPGYADELLMYRLNSAGTLVCRVGHMYNVNDADYDTIPIMVPSPDGMRAVFVTTWTGVGGANRPVHVFVVDWRHLCA